MVSRMTRIVAWCVNGVFERGDWLLKTLHSDMSGSQMNGLIVRGPGEAESETIECFMLNTNLDGLDHHHEFRFHSHRKWHAEREREVGQISAWVLERDERYAWLDVDSSSSDKDLPMNYRFSIQISFDGLMVNVEEVVSTDIVDDGETPMERNDSGLEFFICSFIDGISSRGSSVPVWSISLSIETLTLGLICDDRGPERDDQDGLRPIVECRIKDLEGESKKNRLTFFTGDNVVRVGGTSIRTSRSSFWLKVMRMLMGEGDEGEGHRWSCHHRTWLCIRRNPWRWLRHAVLDVLHRSFVTMVQCWSLVEKSTGREEIMVCVAHVHDSFLWFVMASGESTDSISSFSARHFHFRWWSLSCRRNRWQCHCTPRRAEKMEGDASSRRALTM